MNYEEFAKKMENGTHIDFADLSGTMTWAAKLNKDLIPELLARNDLKTLFRLFYHTAGMTSAFITMYLNKEV